VNGLVEDRLGLRQGLGDVDRGRALGGQREQMGANRRQDRAYRSGNVRDQDRVAALVGQDELLPARLSPGELRALLVEVQQLAVLGVDQARDFPRPPPLDDCARIVGVGAPSPLGPGEIRLVDILPALKHGDSLYRTAMPDRKNVPGRVNVAVVSDTALTGPFSYSKTGSTFRTVGADSAATRAGLGGVRLVDLFKNNACAIAFVFQHGFQHGPARVKHRLCHFGFNQRG